MSARIDMKRLLPAWEQFRRTTDIAPIRDEAHYERMVAMLDALLDAAGGDERHPAMALVDIVGDLIEDWSIGTLGLLLVAIMITVVVGIIMPQAIAKWALLAPIFIPLFLRLGVEPEVVLAAYRVADSPINIVTPIMAYFPLIVVFALRYDKRSGIGTVIALMLPYFVALTVVWTLFFSGWYLLGIPWGRPILPGLG